MYGWLWRTLPGGLAGRVAGCVALGVGVLALLFFVVFPWAETRLPFNSVNVSGPAPSASPFPAASPTGPAPAGSTPSPTVSVGAGGGEGR